MDLLGGLINRVLGCVCLLDLRIWELENKGREEKVCVLIKHYTCFLKGAYKSSFRDSISRWSPRRKNATSDVINPYRP